MYILASECSDASFMATMLFIKKIVQIIFIIAPILLILLLTIDFSKAVMANDEERIKHLKDVAIKRVIFAILLFFIPLIVDVSFGLLEDTSKFTSCYNNASNENVERLVEKANTEKDNKNSEREKTTQDIQAKQKEEAEKRKKNAEEAAKKAQLQKSNGSSAVSLDSVCNNCSGSEKIAQLAEAMAWPYKTKDSVYHHNYSSSDMRKFKSWNDLTGAKPTTAFMNAYDKVRPKHGFKSRTAIGADCGIFVTAVVKAAGYGDGMGWDELDDYFKKSSKWTEVSSKDSKRGDVCKTTNPFHTYIYLGNNRVAEAGHFSNNFGHISKGNCKGDRVFRAI